MNNFLATKILKTALTYDDVLLVPHYSAVLPNETDLTTTLFTESKTKVKTLLKLPILSAAMDTVTEGQMAIAMALNGGAGVIHKNLSIQRQVAQVQTVKSHNYDKNKWTHASVDTKKRLIVGAAIGIGDLQFERCKQLASVQVDFFVLDSAHAHSQKYLNYLTQVKQLFPHICIIAGNVATAEAALALIEHKADAIKVGIGPGSICTTRIVTGVGLPQLTALADVLEVCLPLSIPVIADGGIKTSGDIVKALALGASLVMLGNMLSGTDESSGRIIEIANQKMKSYVGMGSLMAMNKGSSERYFQEKSQKYVPEGVEALVHYKGSVNDILYQIAGGIKAGMGYLGAANLASLKDNAQFVQITNSALKESYPHSLATSFGPMNNQKTTKSDD